MITTPKGGRRLAPGTPLPLCVKIPVWCGGVPSPPIRFILSAVIAPVREDRPPVPGALGDGQWGARPWRRSGHACCTACRASHACAECARVSQCASVRARVRGEFILATPNGRTEKRCPYVATQRPPYVATGAPYWQQLTWHARTASCQARSLHACVPSQRQWGSGGSEALPSRRGSQSSHAR